MSVRQRVLHSAPLIAFALAIVFLGLSLGGYDPADPPGHGAEPSNQPPHNPCGPVGAVIAHVLFNTLGWSSWLLLLGLAVVNLLVATRRPVPDKLGPAIGFGLVLVAASGFIHKIAPPLMPSPAVGSWGLCRGPGGDFPRSAFWSGWHAADPRCRRAVSAWRYAMTWSSCGRSRRSAAGCVINGGAANGYTLRRPRRPRTWRCATTSRTGIAREGYRPARSRHRSRCTPRSR